MLYRYSLLYAETGSYKLSRLTRKKDKDEKKS